MSIGGCLCTLEMGECTKVCKMTHCNMCNNVVEEVQYIYVSLEMGIGKEEAGCLHDCNMPNILSDHLSSCPLFLVDIISLSI